MNDLEYLTIYRWMINDLELSGNDLLVFAFIYSYSRDGKSTFNSGQTYISEFTGIRRETVNRILSRLVSGKFISEYPVKTSKGKCVNYAFNPECEKIKSAFKCALGQCDESSHRGCDDSSHIDIYDSIYSNKNLTKVSNIEEKKNQKNFYRKFGHLSITHSEVSEIMELGYSEDQINSTLDDIENYRKNTQYKSLKLTLRKWLTKNFPNTNPKKSQTELNLNNEQHDPYSRDNFFDFFNR